MRWHGPMGEWSWMMGLGWIPMLLFWALVLVALIYLVRQLVGANRRTGRPEPDDSLQILKQRLARGEIDEAEFNRLYERLRQDE